MTPEEPVLPDLRETLTDITHRLEELARAVTRSGGAGPVGQPLSETERRALADLESLLAIGPEVDRTTALLLAVDRVIHRAGADCAAVYLPEPGGDLDAASHRGFHTPPPRVSPRAGMVGRAFLEGLTIQAGPADRRGDALLAEHGVEHAVGVPLRGAGGPSLGVLLAGRRRPVSFDRTAVELLHLLADRLGLVLRASAAPLPEGEHADENLDLAATGDRVAREAARRLGTPHVAVLLLDPGETRVVGQIGIRPDAPLPDPETEPLATARASGRGWIAPDEAASEPLRRFLGAPPRLVTPLVAGGRLVALLVAGGPRPVSPATLEPLLGPAARALRNARLFSETRAALAERRAWERRSPPPAPPAVRDFAGLLAVLLARVGLVRERVTDPALAADLGVAEEAAWRAAEAVRELLGFAPGARMGRLRPLDLGEIIQSAVAETRLRWPAGEAPAPDIEVALEPLPPVRGSADDLREAVHQLLANAAEASPSGTPVRVQARWDGAGQVEVVISDRGAGMTESVQRQAVEPFFSTKGAGRLGLGLPVAQAIVTRHHGELHLDTAVGRGTTVRLTLPTAGVRAPDPAADAPTGPIRVLVIEDEQVVRDALVSLLEQHGHVALGVADGEAGLAAVQREAPDVVITDLALPGLSGLEVASAVKRLRPGTPVILFTAWPGRLDAAEIRASGVDRVIEKPVGGAQLFGALEGLVARRRDARA